jgi:uncharacterized protein YqeY
MGSFLDRLTTDMKTALKAGDKPRLEVLRMLVSELKKRAIDAQVDALAEADEVAVLQKAVKTRQDSVTQARAANRADIADREAAEIAVIETYLPKQLSAAEVAEKVQALAKEIQFAGGKDTGRFMKEWMARYKGLADGRLVQEALKGLGS